MSLRKNIRSKVYMNEVFTDLGLSPKNRYGRLEIEQLEDTIGEEIFGNSNNVKFVKKVEQYIIDNAIQPAVLYAQGTGGATLGKIELDNGVYKLYLKITDQDGSIRIGAGMNGGETPWTCTISNTVGSAIGSADLGDVSPGQYADWTFVKNVAEISVGEEITIPYKDQLNNTVTDSMVFVTV